MNVIDSAQSVVHAHPVSTGVAVTTTGTGLASILNLIPDEIGKLASLIGIVLSIVIIYSTIITLRKTMRERELLEMQIRKLQDDND